MPYLNGVTPPAEAALQNFSTETVGNLVTHQETKTLYDLPIQLQMWNLERHTYNAVGFSDMLRWMGGEIASSNATTGHYETPYHEDLFPVGAITTPAAGPGANIVLTIDASGMLLSGATQGGAARSMSGVMLNDVYEFRNGVQGQVVLKNEAVTPHQITVRPLKATDNLNTVITAGESYACVAPLFAEASGLPGQKISRTFKYQNTFGITKSARKYSGSAATNMIYTQNTSGQSGSVIKFMDPMWMKEHQEKRDRLLMFGQQADNLTETNQVHSGIDIQIFGTEGAYTFARTGNNDTYTAGAWSLDDLTQVATILVDQQASQNANVVGYVGRQYQAEIDAALLAITQNDVTPFINNMIPGYSDFDFKTYASQDASYDSTFNFGIRAIRYSQMNFAWKSVSAFQNTRNFGHTLYPYSSMAIYMPTERTAYGRGRDVKMLGIMNYEYKALDGYSRNLVMDEYRGVGAPGSGAASNEFDSVQFGALSELAMHCATNNKIVVQQKA